MLTSTHHTLSPGMGVFRNEWDRQVSKKMPCAFKEQCDEVLRSLKFVNQRTKTIGDGYRGL